MISGIKNQRNILDKLKIENLNEMQEEAQNAIHSNPEVVLLSPTGTGKTLAFLLPIIAELDSECKEIQVLILVPSRELAIQIEQVIREMGTGYKVNAVYGGRSGSKDRAELKHLPAILVGTPGRVADRLRRDGFSTEYINTIVLDEFDKSLEIGFEEEMREIMEALPKIQKKVLTSATNGTVIPDFVRLRNPITIDYSDEGGSKLKLKTVISESKDKLDSLVDLLSFIAFNSSSPSEGQPPGIIFCNFKDSIDRVSEYLEDKGISHGCFYGGMEQKDRERALIKFRNGTHQLLLATDLAARGLDIPELKFIIHYHLPNRKDEFTHRNGRTARMNADGTAYIMKWRHEDLPTYIENSSIVVIDKSPLPEASKWKTLFISGGRKDKISKGDVAGLFFKQGKLKGDQLGVIELKHDCAFVSVEESKINQLLGFVDNSRLKKKKVRVTLI